ncbi:MAG TPA: glycosyltransferase [Steroidobacteraceae bacterium]|jgi:glycosyltransferase involved in cell wall biosynthesis
MRIAHMLLSRGFAGTERATAEMCNAHVSEHAVLLIIRRDHRGAGGASIRDRLDPAVQVVEVGRWWPLAAVRAALTRFTPDVVHAHLRRSTRLLAGIAPPAATIATLHLTVNGPHFAAMDGLICIAAWQQRDIPRDYAGLIFSINESMIPARRLHPEEVTTRRAELGVSEPQQFLIGAVGRLARSKGFDLLMAAFERAALPAAHLAIIGDGRERSRLTRMAGPGVSLTGFRADVKDYYQAFDLFVCPSRREPLGRVVLEALDAGVPVVASATDGPSELLGRYGGDLVPVGDVDALAARLRHHYQARTPHVRHDLSAYNIEAVAGQTLAAYDGVIQARFHRVRPSG